MPSCCVPGCKSRYYKKPNGIQFFSFPTKRSEQCALWSKAVARDNWKSSKWTKICSFHFTKLDYFPRFSAVARYLKRNAAPTQMMSSRDDSTMENCGNDPTIEDRRASKRGKVEVRKLRTMTKRKSQCNPQPIALIKVLHKVPNPIDDGNGRNGANEQILPDHVSDATVADRKIDRFDTSIVETFEPATIERPVETVQKPTTPEPSNRIFVRKPITILRKLLQKVAEPRAKDEKIDIDRTAHRKPVQSMVNEKSIAPIVVLPGNSDETIVAKKPIPPIKILTRKLPNGVNRKRMKQPLIRILPRQIPIAVVSAKQTEPVKILVHKSTNDNRIVPIKILPRLNNNNPMISVKQGCELFDTTLKQSFDSSNNVKQSFDLSNSVKQSFDLLNSVKQSLDLSSDVKQSFNLSNNVKQSLDLLNNVKQSFELTKNVKQTFDSTKIVKQTFDSTKIVKQTFDLTKNVKQSQNSSKNVKQSQNSSNNMNHSKIDTAHHTMRILPVENSNPIIAVHCSLSNQDTYMLLPTQYSPNNNNNNNNNNHKTTKMKNKNKKIPEIVMIDDESEKDDATNKNVTTNEDSEIQTLKNEVVKLNQIVMRQEKRLQYLMQLRATKREQKREDDNT